MLSKGASVLHLSGIVGDDEKEQASYGEPRTILSFFQKGYARNGLKLINLIHIADLCKIIAFFSDNSHANAIKAERVIVSGGAFRLQELAKGMGVDPLPEMIPPDSSMKGSKIVSVAKLCSILPDDYQWTLPVDGVKPVSMGLPITSTHKYYPDGATQDRQWDIHKHNVRGKWQGTALWYEKSNILDFLASLNGETLPPPSLMSPDTEYCIYFLDAYSAVWDGKGLRFAPEGTKRFDYSREKFNMQGKCFLFEGAASQIATDLNQKGPVGSEVSFFYERSRSMIIVLYKPDPTSSKYLLDTVAIVPFRCGYGFNFPLKPPQSEVRRSVTSLLAGLQDKTCRMQWMSHTRALDETNGGEIQIVPTKSMLLLSSPDSSRLIQSFDDDLVCSVPGELIVGQSFELVFGCRHTDDFFQAITLTYSCEGKLERQTFERWD